MNNRKNYYLSFAFVFLMFGILPLPSMILTGRIELLIIPTALLITSFTFYKKYSKIQTLEQQLVKQKLAIDAKTNELIGRLKNEFNHILVKNNLPDIDEWRIDNFDSWSEKDISSVDTGRLGFGELKRYVIVHSGKIHMLYPFDGFKGSLLDEKNIDAYINMLYIAIEIKELDWFKKVGEIVRDTIVSGGGGGGSSLTGALIGGALAGSAGAIIGSRKKVNEITTQIKTTDYRATLIKVGNQYYVFKGWQIYDYLDNYIPQKEISVSHEVKKQKEVQKSNSTHYMSAVETREPESDIESRLKKLKDMYERGLLSEFDYQKKKDQILELL